MIFGACALSISPSILSADSLSLADISDAFFSVLSILPRFSRTVFATSLIESTMPETLCGSIALRMPSASASAALSCFDVSLSRAAREAPSRTRA